MIKYLKKNWAKLVANLIVMTGGVLAIEYGPELADAILDISFVKRGAQGLWILIVATGWFPGDFPEEVIRGLTSLISSK